LNEVGIAFFSVVSDVRKYSCVICIHAGTYVSKMNHGNFSILSICLDLRATGEIVLSEKFTDPQAALDRVIEIYASNTAILRAAFKQFTQGQEIPQRVRACYPFVRITTDKVTHTDTRQSFGFVAGPGTYQTTLTQPVLFSQYLLSQFKLLLQIIKCRWRSASASCRFRCICVCRWHPRRR